MDPKAQCRIPCIRDNLLVVAWKGCANAGVLYLLGPLKRRTRAPRKPIPIVKVQMLLRWCWVVNGM